MRRATRSSPTSASPSTAPRAEDAVDLLADVHRTFAGAPLPAGCGPSRRGGRWRPQLADLRRVKRPLPRGPDAPAALADPDRVWRAFERSIALHGELPQHADPLRRAPRQLVRDGDGRMGLCDWQCVSAGHWSLDVAYALTTLLTIEDRRAWERDLLARYLERSGAPESPDEAFDALPPADPARC